MNYKTVEMKSIFKIIFGIIPFCFFGQVDKAEDISPLLIGEKIPTVFLRNIEGEKVASSEIFSKKTVLIIYRGGWCPYCNRQLSGIAEIEKEIVAMNYQIVAVSPDSPEQLKKSKGENHLNYDLFSDSEGFFSTSLGLTFSTPEKYSSLLEKYSEGKNKTWLPVPAVYVMNEDKVIEFLYINPDYSKRLSPDLLLAVLKTL